LRTHWGYHGGAANGATLRAGTRPAPTTSGEHLAFFLNKNSLEGDLNKDGYVNIVDVKILVNRILMGN